MPTIKNHDRSGDWCHVCGSREDAQADVWYPENAEHSKDDQRYIRICEQCANLILAAIFSGRPPERDASKDFLDNGLGYVETVLGGLTKFDTGSASRSDAILKALKYIRVAQRNN